MPPHDRSAAAIVTFSDTADNRYVALQGRAFVHRSPGGPAGTAAAGAGHGADEPEPSIYVDVAEGEWWDARAGLVGQLISLARAGLGRPEDEHGAVVV